jgi:hypothetical protein
MPLISAVTPSIERNLGMTKRTCRLSVYVMSFSEVLAELPALSLEERQIIVRRALELDEVGLSPADEALVDERLAAHKRDPKSAVSLAEMKARLRSQFAK